ncbi:Gfo/Idh/MocA family protein [Lignipirellula cremea]|uniref:Glucose--fructose oxidoreductase n=1 Tax=Lignipirellula cremea TaxID=2528010 RepID=A0A518DW32_9BACT|nr:Gfo/Idh/MocA family oxidoreductase [Lignipirellula cremea]QDU96034.1 Glucose--fructose oxidoreductase precursor [Lignipirellula cremea]
MRRIKTAIIGCGKIGQTHAQALSTLAESEFVAVCDAQLSRAQSFAEQYRVQAFDSVAEMLSRADVEAVTICTPHPLHEEPCLQAAQAGVHVLIEKPMASSLKSCDAMLEAADKGQIKLGIVSQRRLFEPVQRMKAAIDAGKIGKPILGAFSMFSWRDQAYYQSDPWRGKWETEGGGVLVNQSPHMLDMLQWFMGEIDEVSGYWSNLNHPYMEVEDTALAMIRFKSGALGNVVASLSQKPGIYTKIHIHGANGASVGVQTDTGATFVAGMSGVTEPPLNDVWTIPGEEHQLGEFEAADRQSFQTIDVATHYHALQIQDFLRSILEDRSPLVTGEEGRIVVEMFTAIYRSNELGRPVRFPL